MSLDTFLDWWNSPDSSPSGPAGDTSSGDPTGAAGVEWNGNLSLVPYVAPTPSVAAPAAANKPYNAADYNWNTSDTTPISSSGSSLGWQGQTASPTTPAGATSKSGGSTFQYQPLNPASLASLFSTFMPKTPTVTSPTANAQTALSAMQNQSAQNLGTAKANIQTATSLGTATAKQIDDLIQQRTLAMYQQLNPNWQNEVATGAASVQNAQAVVNNYLTQYHAPAMAQTKALADTAAGQAQTELRGQLPQDVVQQIRQSSAETAGIKQGTVGEAPAGSAVRNLVARDLGLNSLQVTQQGGALATTASNLYGRLSDLASSATALAVSPGTAATNQLASMKNLTPASVLTQTPSLITSLAGDLNNASIIQPNTVGSLYQSAQNSSQALQEAIMNSESEARVSSANAAMSLNKLANNMSGSRSILGPIA